MDALSIHDHYLLSYEVNHSEQKIILHTEFNYPPEPRERTDAIFTGVEGYQLANDAVGRNILHGIYQIPVRKFLEQFGEAVQESWRLSGAPAPWAADIPSAAATLEKSGVKAYELTSSLGIGGWILARGLEYRRSDA